MSFGSFCQILFWFLGGSNAKSYWFLGRFQFIFNRFLQLIEGKTDLTYFDNSKYMSENHTRTFWVLFVNIFTKYLSLRLIEFQVLSKNNCIWFLKGFEVVLQKVKI